jgi:multidrug resistance efflux pump
MTHREPVGREDFQVRERSKHMPSFVRVLSLVGIAAGLHFGTGSTFGAQDRKSVEVTSPIEGKTTYQWIRPEGSPVETGEMVCELDQGALKARRAEQAIATRAAEARYQNARLTREVAEIGVVEYIEGVFQQETATAKGEIALGESNLKRAEDRVEWAEKMAEKRFLSEAQLTSDRLALQQAKFALEQAKVKKKILEKYTGDKIVKGLRAEVEKARADELAKKAIFEGEKKAEARLLKDAARFKIVAPVSGRVHYPRPIDASTEVREGELLFRLVPEEDEAKPR